MRKGFALTVFVFAAALNLIGATIAGVTLPDSIDVGGTKLVLNGIGVRTKVFFKVYVAGLYLEQKSGDPAAIVKADAPKRLLMHFVRDLDRNQVYEAYNEAFDNNAPQAKQQMKADVDKLLGAFEEAKEGDQWAFTYQPGVGTTLTIKGKDKVTIPGLPFAQAMFSCWLGPKPPTSDLKNKLLGK